MNIFMLIAGIVAIVFGFIIESSSVIGSIPSFNMYMDIDIDEGYPAFKPGSRQILGFIVGMLLIAGGILLIVFG